MNIKMPFGMKEMDVIARAIAVAGSVKDSMTPSKPSESESVLLQEIKKFKDKIHNKNAEIFKLGQRIKDLEQTLTITEELRKEAEMKLCKEGIE